MVLALVFLYTLWWPSYPSFDSRQLITRNNITEVAYNVQTVVDAKHNLPIDHKVTNENDSKAMGGMLRMNKSDFKYN